MESSDKISQIHRTLVAAIKPFKFNTYGEEVIAGAAEVADTILLAAVNADMIESYTVASETVAERKEITLNITILVDPDANHSECVNITFTCRQ